MSVKCSTKAPNTLGYGSVGTQKTSFFDTFCSHSKRILIEMTWMVSGKIFSE